LSEILKVKVLKHSSQNIKSKELSYFFTIVQFVKLLSVSHRPF